MSVLEKTPAWTPEQIAVLEHSGSALAVLAGAGAGKTSVLVEKCRRLLTQRPDARICAVSFTEKSASDLRLKLSRFDLSRHWVTTIHGLCGMILREFPESLGLQGDERVLSEAEASELWKESLETLWFDPRDSTHAEAAALQRLLAREGRAGLEELLARTRDLDAAGLLEMGPRSSPAELGSGFSDLALTAKRLLDSYNGCKRAAGALDFSDLEKLAAQVMGMEQVRESLRRRFDLVLVDEFQDTNAIQASIIWNLARPDLSNLCVVGDPKQSIYRFRDADVSLFEELCDALPSRLSLTSNFRSRPGILEFVNRICPPIFEASSLSYLPLIAGRDDGAASGHPVVARMELEDPAELARHLMEHNARGVPWDRMAILMVRIKGNERWIHALSRRGIPLAVGGGGLFWADPRVRELVSMLRWWAYPADEMAGLAFLRAPWVAVDDGQLDRWLGSAQRLEAFWSSDHPIARVLVPQRVAGAAPVRPAELLVQLLSSGELEERVASLRQSALALIHRLEELSAGGRNFGEVLGTLQEFLEEGKRDKDVPPPKNRGVLPVLTIHASKGLEFDHVYLVDLGKKGRARTPPLLFWDRRKGAFLTERDEDGKRVDNDARYLEWKAHEHAAAVAESKRLFYVALTRARESLLLACETVDPTKGIEADSERAALGDHWRAWVEHFGGKLPAVEAPKEAELQPGQRPSPSDQNSAVPPVRLPGTGLERARHAVTEWTLLSRCERAYVRSVLGAAPAKAVQTGERDEDPGEGASPDPWAQGVSAVELGKRVHALLEAWARFPAEHEAIAGQLLELEALGTRFRAAPVLEWLGSTTWLQGEGLSEWPFEWRVGRTSLVGAIDRLSFSEGVLTVLDYKVFSALKDPGVVRELYGPQLELYAGAVDAFVRQNPETGVSEIRARVVQIAPEGVEEVEIPIDPASIRERAPEFAVRAAVLVGAPEQGEARPTARESCRHCPHRNACDAVSVR